MVRLIFWLWLINLLDTSADQGISGKQEDQGLETKNCVLLATGIGNYSLITNPISSRYKTEDLRQEQIITVVNHNYDYIDEQNKNNIPEHLPKIDFDSVGNINYKENIYYDSINQNEMSSSEEFWFKFKFFFKKLWKKVSSNNRDRSYVENIGYIDNERYKICPRLFAGTAYINDTFYCCGGYLYDGQLEYSFVVANDCLITKNPQIGPTGPGGFKNRYKLQSILDFWSIKNTKAGVDPTTHAFNGFPSQHPLYGNYDRKYNREKQDLFNIRVKEIKGHWFIFNESDVAFVNYGSDFGKENLSKIKDKKSLTPLSKYQVPILPSENLKMVEIKSEEKLPSENILELNENTLKERVKAPTDFRSGQKINRRERLFCEDAGYEHFMCIVEHNQFEFWGWKDPKSNFKSDGPPDDFFSGRQRQNNKKNKKFRIDSGLQEPSYEVFYLIDDQTLNKLSKLTINELESKQKSSKNQHPDDQFLEKIAYHYSKTNYPPFTFDSRVHKLLGLQICGLTLVMYYEDRIFTDGTFKITHYNLARNGFYLPFKENPNESSNSQNCLNKCSTYIFPHKTGHVTCHSDHYSNLIKNENRDCHYENDTRSYSFELYSYYVPDNFNFVDCGYDFPKLFTQPADTQMCRWSRYRPFYTEMFIPKSVLLQFLLLFILLISLIYYYFNFKYSKDRFGFIHFKDISQFLLTGNPISTGSSATVYPCLWIEKDLTENNNGLLDPLESSYISKVAIKKFRYNNINSPRINNYPEKVFKLQEQNVKANKAFAWIRAHHDKRFGAKKKKNINGIANINNIHNKKPPTAFAKITARFRLLWKDGLNIRHLTRKSTLITTTAHVNDNSDPNTVKTDLKSDYDDDDPNMPVVRTQIPGPNGNGIDQVDLQATLENIERTLIAEELFLDQNKAQNNGGNNKENEENQLNHFTSTSRQNLAEIDENKPMNTFFGQPPSAIGTKYNKYGRKIETKNETKNGDHNGITTSKPSNGLNFTKKTNTTTTPTTAGPSLNNQATIGSSEIGVSGAFIRSDYNKYFKSSNGNYFYSNSEGVCSELLGFKKQPLHNYMIEKEKLDKKQLDIFNHELQVLREGS